MQRILFSAAIAVLAAAPFVVPSAGWAAPQVLGLVATTGPVPLHCADGSCEAEFSSFCLQSERSAPAAGTRYLAVGGGEIRAAARTRDGREIMLEPGRHLEFHASRGHVAVRVSVPRSIVSELALTEVTVTVAQHVALKPEPVAGDTNPVTDEELALAAGPLRRLGTQFVDRNADRMEAARIANRMINALPRKGPFTTAERAAVWRSAAGNEGALSPGARKYARNAFVLCDFALDSGAKSSLRRCLELQHDSLLNFLNSGYWKAVGAGS